jgi:large subunit ribosomal protein L6
MANATSEIKIPRLARSPIALAGGAEATVNGQHVAVKGPKGQLELNVHDSVEVSKGDDGISVKPLSSAAAAMSGTMHSLLKGMVQGVTQGFEKKLTLIGVGYRAQAQGKTLNLSLGFSHPIEFAVPEGITIQTPSQTEVIVSGADKQQVGQVAAKIRSYRPPEPYKGKGVRYADEYVLRKEAKKK